MGGLVIGIIILVVLLVIGVEYFAQAGAKPECDADDDCSTTAPFCVSSKCAVCRSNTDCGADEFCVAGKCGKCSTDTDCADPDKPYCASGKCSACRDSGDCPPDGECIAGKCVNGCNDTTKKCPTSAPYCVGGTCIACRNAEDCKSAGCKNGKCGACIAGECAACDTSSCPADAPHCTDNGCVRCRDSNDCPAGTACEAHECVSTVARCNQWRAFDLTTKPTKIPEWAAGTVPGSQIAPAVATIDGKVAGGALAWDGARLIFRPVGDEYRINYDVVARQPATVYLVERDPQCGSMRTLAAPDLANSLMFTDPTRHGFCLHDLRPMLVDANFDGSCQRWAYDSRFDDPVGVNYGTARPLADDVVPETGDRCNQWREFNVTEHPGVLPLWAAGANLNRTEAPAVAVVNGVVTGGLIRTLATGKTKFIYMGSMISGDGSATQHSLTIDPSMVHLLERDSRCTEALQVLPGADLDHTMAYNIPNASPICSYPGGPIFEAGDGTGACPQWGYMKTYGVPLPVYDDYPTV